MTSYFTWGSKIQDLVPPLLQGSQGKALFTKPNCPHMPSSGMQFVGSNEPHNFTRHKVSSKQLWQVI